MADDSIHFFPLSPIMDLQDECSLVYFSFLENAFSHEQHMKIHNIAITGAFGSGKSSLIRSFENWKISKEVNKSEDVRSKRWPTITSFWRQIISFLKKKTQQIRHPQTVVRQVAARQFLYISIGEYVSNTDKTPANEKEIKYSSINQVERRMLLQVFSRFQKKDIPQSSYRLIPMDWAKKRTITSSLISAFVFAALLLVFHEPLGNLLLAISKKYSSTTLIAPISSFLVQFKTLIRFLLASLSILTTSAIAGYVCYNLMPRIRFSDFSVKGSVAEVSLKSADDNSYLDQYSMELVYCLERVAEKIDHTVVFEDLDRLNPLECAFIITRLREINHLVNMRLLAKGECIRFVYAVNDGFLAKIQHEKFFDYILPVIPSLNKSSAAFLFAEKVKLFDRDYGEKLQKCFPQFETIASCLNDYRMLNTILNEFQVLCQLYKKTNVSKDETLSDITKNEILAFAIYKNCWPEDYHALLLGQSVVFTKDGVKYPQNIKKTFGHLDLLELLTDSTYHILTLHSLYYACFNVKKLVEFYCAKWDGGSIIEDIGRQHFLSDIKAFQSADTDCLEAAGNYFVKQFNAHNPRNVKLFVPVFRGLLTHMTNCKYSQNDWIKPKNFLALNDALELLAEMKEDKDEQLKWTFVECLNRSAKSGNALGATNTDLKNLSLNESTLKELCRCYSHLPESISLRYNSKEIRDLERNSIIISIRKDLHATKP